MWSLSTVHIENSKYCTEMAAITGEKPICYSSILMIISLPCLLYPHILAFRHNRNTETEAIRECFCSSIQFVLLLREVKSRDSHPYAMLYCTSIALQLKRKTYTLKLGNVINSTMFRSMSARNTCKRVLHFSSSKCNGDEIMLR